ncbi:MAG: imidazolonepropionase [Elusimicrobiota bacterium]
MTGGDVAILIREGRIVEVGPWRKVRSRAGRRAVELNAHGKAVLPGFVDSHTHALFLRPRLADFEARIAGAGYEEIAKKGGGILKTVSYVRGASREELRDSLEVWCRRALALGTTTMEVKSGYGLDLPSEQKMLEVIGSARTPLEIIPTFLGAHALAPEYRAEPERYVEEIIKVMLPRLRRLARFCDVFCDRGYFSLVETRKILTAAKKLGYGLKIHAEQLSCTGASGLGARLGAASVDHLDHAGSADLERLARSSTVATLLPGCSFFSGRGVWPPARDMIGRGVAVALATDFNPGSSPSLAMGFVLSLAVTQMKMTAQEALGAATINGAYAVGRGDDLGAIEPGRQADIIVTEASDWREIPYYFAMDMVRAVIKKGALVTSKN